MPAAAGSPARTPGQLPPKKSADIPTAARSLLQLCSRASPLTNASQHRLDVQLRAHRDAHRRVRNHLQEKRVHCRITYNSNVQLGAHTDAHRRVRNHLQ